MKPFMDENFLLGNQVAITLFHEYAKDLPIVDYHGHLSPQEIAEDKKYSNIGELWLGGDHYKWRAMRINGIDEKFITGEATDKEKFFKWAETMPHCMGNPLYHWTHLELKRVFGISLLLSPQTAEEIWETCNAKLQEPAFSARGLIRKANVQLICTTDDPLDDLAFHRQITQDKLFDVCVKPTFRADKCVQAEHKDFSQWVGKLSEITRPINNYSEFIHALNDRIAYFHEMGCRVADIAHESFAFAPYSAVEIEDIFKKARSGQALDVAEINKFRTATLVWLGKAFARLGWVMQLHIGAMRNNNESAFNRLGADTGFDTIGDAVFAKGLAQLLNEMEKTDELPKTILYCLNPRDHEVLAAMSGCFQGGGMAGKMQVGPGWWFNDQKDGMERHLTVLANLSLLSRFIGMTTDARSFLSFTRHEYFRRILCNHLGKWVENGEAPCDMALLGNMVQNICFKNAQAYFKL